MKPLASKWIRKKFKGNKVWMALDNSGRPLVQNHKALIKYQLDQDYSYWVNFRDLEDVDAQEPIIKTQDKTLPQKQPQDPQPRGISADDGTLPEHMVHIFTDGASSGNPGPSGIGVWMKYGAHQREISKYIGIATNNVAELKAVEAALMALKRKNLPVRIYTDSKYVYGLLCEGWKAKKNIELIQSIKKRISEFSDLQIIKVQGHAGLDGNERADQLATAAISAQK